MKKPVFLFLILFLLFPIISFTQLSRPSFKVAKPPQPKIRDSTHLNLILFLNLTAYKSVININDAFKKGNSGLAITRKFDFNLGIGHELLSNYRVRAFYFASTGLESHQLLSDNSDALAIPANLGLFLMLGHFYFIPQGGPQFFLKSTDPRLSGNTYFEFGGDIGYERQFKNGAIFNVHTSYRKTAGINFLGWGIAYAFPLI